MHAVPTGERIGARALGRSQAYAGGKRRVWSGTTEEIKECGRAYKTNEGGAGSGAVRHSKALAQRARRKQENAARAHVDARIGCAAGYDHSERIAYAESGSGGIKRILCQQLGICGIDVHRTVQMQTAGPLVRKAEFPGGCKFALNGEIRLMRVGVDEVL